MFPIGYVKTSYTPLLILGEIKMQLGYYDPTTGKIHGVKEGTLAWHHEMGHKLFHELGYSIRTGVWQYQALVFTLISIVLQIDPWDHIFLGLFIGIHLFEEIWCWRYALKKQKEQKKIEKREKEEREKQTRLKRWEY